MAVISVVGFLIGMVLSFYANLPTGASIVCVDLVMLGAALGVAKIRRG